MKRLIEETFAPGTPEDQLATLVRASPRFEAEPFAKPRVLARVLLPHARGRGILPRSVASVVLFGGTAIAAAAVGNHLWTSHQRIESAREVSTASEHTMVPVGAQGLAAAPRAMSVPDLAPTSSPNEAPEWSSSPRPVAPGANRGHSVGNAVVRPASNPKASVASEPKAVRRPDKDGEDPGQVLEAIRSLRANGNAARASGLLDDYMRDHPRGVLTEDALALSIEAADARHDRRAAGDYAERYIRLYPGGRFRSLADVAVERRGQ